MKTRRLCAVIAAAATLLGGMAFGTAGAYAAGSASIEVRHSQEGHTYSAYKFASLTVDGDAVQVDTDADWVQAVTEAVVEANNAMDPAGTMPSEYDSNPAAFAATKTGDNDAAWFREFAKAMKAGTGVTADGTVAGNGGAATIGSLDEGWYLVTDTDKDGELGVNAIVATTLNGLSATFKVKGDAVTGQGMINAVGAFVAKNENDPDQPGKTADSITTEDGVGIGQTITYTITLDIPDAAAGYDTYPYYVKDVASKGLTVNKDFAAKIGDKDMSFTYVTEPTVDNDSGKTTTVLKFDLAGKSGQLVITYTAVVNKDIISAGNQVSNTAEVSRDNENWTPPVVFEAYTGEFAFHKYGVGDDANGLAGATSRRITYTESFKHNCMRRYHAGESPVELFREAGLDPSLIGYKRIERCFARWRKIACRMGTDRLVSVDGNGGVMPSASAGVVPSADSAEVARSAVSQPVQPTQPAETQSNATLPAPRNAAEVPILSGGDVRDLLIAQQVRRIDELEREVAALRAELHRK